ncbi:MAG: cytochrome c biogenesis protein CcdA [Candidatus Paceibacteria bacterium]|jgi:cytochrome c biogenesis protein CcdA
MTLLLVSFLAGILTVLAPCILPLLPVVIGSSVGARSKSTPFIVIGSLALSILLFTYLLKASTALIDIPPQVWSYLSGGILVGFGIILIFPRLWESLPFVAKTSVEANKLMGAGHQKKSIWGDVLIGAALGPVFSTCSPTYFVILATVLPASFWLGTTYLLAYIFGLVLVLSLIAIIGQKLITRIMSAASSESLFKRGIGVLFFIVGIAIVSGFDKKIETKIIDSEVFDVTQIEQRLLDKLETENTMTEPNENASAVDIPSHLLELFPNTDWDQSNPKLAEALSGGPSKDGIPALEDPKFIPLSEADYPDEVATIVMIGKNETKVYPYNILTWHEIVNDTVDDVPVAVTFCPLCGSAIVYDRTLTDGTVTTFGVSGSLLESNMIMYDRSTENLWQQSTGQVLAGSFFGAQLKLVPFQLMNLGEVKTRYSDAQILSSDTGYSRDYDRNPYSGYETDNRFVFEPSTLDTTFPLKTIMTIFRTKDSTPVATPWLALREAQTTTETIDGESYSLTATDSGELTIVDKSGLEYPFYFEMWFSFATQHGEERVVIIP